MKTISEGAPGPRRRSDIGSQMADTGSAAGDQAGSGPWEARGARAEGARPGTSGTSFCGYTGARALEGGGTFQGNAVRPLPPRRQGHKAGWSGGASAAHEGRPSWDDAPAAWPAASPVRFGGAVATAVAEPRRSLGPPKWTSGLHGAQTRAAGGLGPWLEFVLATLYEGIGRLLELHHMENRSKRASDSKVAMRRGLN